MKVVVCHERDLSPLPDGRLDVDRAVCTSRGGGLAVYLAQVIPGLRGRGIDVTAVEFDPEAPGEEKLADDYHRLRSFRFRFRPRTFEAFQRILSDEMPDVVHLQGLFHEMHPRIAEWLLERFKVVWTLHDVRGLCFRGTRLNRQRKLCGRAVGVACVTCGCYLPGEKAAIPIDVLRVLRHESYLRGLRRIGRVLVPSGYIKRALVENGFDGGRIEVTPLFTRFEHAEAVEGDPKRVLFVGRLDPDKGVEEFVEAMGLLRGEAWEAIVVGDGPTRGTAQALAAVNGIDDRVRFVGAAAGEALAEHYRRCAFVVFSSMIPESFGLVGVEAMSFGKPVAAFASGGVTQWLEDGITGLIAPHGDVRALADNIRRLLRDDDLRRRLGDNARAAVEEKFTLCRHLDGIEHVYHEMLGHLPTAARAAAEVVTCAT